MKALKKMGMIYKVYPQDDFEKEETGISFQNLNITKALSLTKKLLNSSVENSLEEQLNLEDRYQSVLANTEDFNEGVKALFRKKKINFKGK